MTFLETRTRSFNRDLTINTKIISRIHQIILTNRPQDQHRLVFSVQHATDHGKVHLRIFQLPSNTLSLKSTVKMKFRKLNKLSLPRDNKLKNNQDSKLSRPKGPWNTLLQQVSVVAEPRRSNQRSRKGSSTETLNNTQAPERCMKTASLISKELANRSNRRTSPTSKKAEDSKNLQIKSMY